MVTELKTNSIRIYLEEVLVTGTSSVKELLSLQDFLDNIPLADCNMEGILHRNHPRNEMDRAQQVTCAMMDWDEEKIKLLKISNLKLISDLAVDYALYCIDRFP